MTYMHDSSCVPSHDQQTDHWRSLSLVMNRIIWLTHTSSRYIGDSCSCRGLALTTHRFHMYVMVSAFLLEDNYCTLLFIITLHNATIEDSPS